MRSQARRRKNRLLEAALLILCASIFVSVSLPRWIQAKEASHISLCVRQLVLIDAAKESYALGYGLEEGQRLPDPGVLNEYLRGGMAELKCPRGGRYYANPIGVLPSCSVNGHHI